MIPQLDILSIDFNIIRIVLAFAMLSIASFLDLKKREVHDYLWLCFGAVAVILFVLELGNDGILLKTILAAVIVPIAFVMTRFGIFGGADAFAVSVLAVLAPFATLSDEQITPFTTLTNAAILSMVMLMVNAAQNLKTILKRENIFDGFDESWTRKLVACFVGTYSKNPKYGFSIEKKVGKHKKLNLTLQHAENTDFCKTPNTWITPGIPFILYIFGGFLVQVFFGDLFFVGWKLFPII